MDCPPTLLPAGRPQQPLFPKSFWEGCQSPRLGLLGPEGQGIARTASGLRVQDGPAGAAASCPVALGTQHTMVALAVLPATCLFGTLVE